MSKRLTQFVRDHGFKLFIAWILLLAVATTVDTICYTAFVTRQGGSLLGLLNPAALMRYMLTPVGILLRIVILSPFLALILAALLLPRRA